MVRLLDPVVDLRVALTNVSTRPWGEETYAGKIVDGNFSSVLTF